MTLRRTKKTVPFLGHPVLRLELGDNTDIISVYSTTVTYLASKAIKFGENAKRAITPFKVFQGHRGRYQSTTRMRLLIVINSNLQHILYSCGVIAVVQILDTAFLSHPFGSLVTNVRCSSWAHWKARSRLPISVN